jgi:hypothetical protein
LFTIVHKNLQKLLANQLGEEYGLVDEDGIVEVSKVDVPSHTPFQEKPK